MGNNLIGKIGKALVVPGMVSLCFLLPNFFRKNYSFENSTIVQKPSVFNYIVERNENEIIKYSLGLGGFPDEKPSKIVVNGKRIVESDENYKSLCDRYFLIQDKISEQQ